VTPAPTDRNSKNGTWNGEDLAAGGQITGPRKNTSTALQAPARRNRRGWRGRGKLGCVGGRRFISLRQRAAWRCVERGAGADTANAVVSGERWFSASSACAPRDPRCDLFHRPFPWIVDSLGKKSDNTPTLIRKVERPSGRQPICSRLRVVREDQAAFGG
jgi:hypothetical protein